MLTFHLYLLGSQSHKNMLLLCPFQRRIVIASKSVQISDNQFETFLIVEEFFKWNDIYLKRGLQHGWTIIDVFLEFLVLSKSIFMSLKLLVLLGMVVTVDISLEQLSSFIKGLLKNRTKSLLLAIVFASDCMMLVNVASWVSWIFGQLVCTRSYLQMFMWARETASIN